MEWSSIVTIILGSSLLGVVLNNLAGWWIKHREQSNHATYIALNLAHMFEQYAFTCLSVIEDHDAAECSGGHAGNYLKGIPMLPEFPDYDYRVFDLVILDRVFDFPQQIRFAAGHLSSAFEFLDGEDAVKEGYKGCLKLAHEAVEIADAIREKYTLKKRLLEFSQYSVRTRIEEKLSHEKS